MPSILLSVIKHMYENDEYILMDGEKRARVHPTNGVKQGCPLSPLLFSLYINDMGREISEGIEGAVTGDRVNCVSHMLYADDLGLTTNDPSLVKCRRCWTSFVSTLRRNDWLWTRPSRRWFILIVSLSLFCRIRSRTMVWCFQRRTGSNIWACCLIEGWIWR